MCSFLLQFISIFVSKPTRLHWFSLTSVVPFCFFLTFQTTGLWWLQVLGCYLQLPEDTVLRHSSYFMICHSNMHLGMKWKVLSVHLCRIFLWLQKLFWRNYIFPPPSYHLIACFEVHTLSGRYVVSPIGLLTLLIKPSWTLSLDLVFFSYMYLALNWKINGIQGWVS